MLFFTASTQNDIKEVHSAAIYGEVEAIDHKEYRQPIYSAKDINGISALHKVRISKTFFASDSNFLSVLLPQAAALRLIFHSICVPFSKWAGS